MSFTRDQKRKALQRELAFRRNVYRKRISNHTMKQDDADREIALLEAILADYTTEPEPFLSPTQIQMIGANEMDDPRLPKKEKP
jgi:hypothetical protein